MLRARRRRYCRAARCGVRGNAAPLSARANRAIPEPSSSGQRARRARRRVHRCALGPAPKALTSALAGLKSGRPAARGIRSCSRTAGRRLRPRSALGPGTYSCRTAALTSSIVSAIKRRSQRQLRFLRPVIALTALSIAQPQFGDPHGGRGVQFVGHILRVKIAAADHPVVLQRDHAERGSIC